MADNDDHDDIDVGEYKRREKSRVRQRKTTLSDGVLSVMIALELGRKPSITGAVERDLKAKRLATKDKYGNWVLTPLGADIAQATLKIDQEHGQIRAKPLEPVEQLVRRAKPRAPTPTRPPRPPSRPPQQSRPQAPAKPVRGKARPAQTVAESSGISEAALQKLIADAVKQGIDEGIRAALTLSNYQPTHAPQAAGDTEAKKDKKIKPPKKPKGPKGGGGVGGAGGGGGQPTAPQGSGDPGGTQAAPEPTPATDIEATGQGTKVTPKPGFFSRSKLAIGGAYAGGRSMLRKARQLTKGEKEAKAEEEGIRRAIVQTGRAAENALTIVNENMETLAKRAPDVLKKAEAFKRADVQDTLGKVRAGREVFPEQAKPLIKAFEELAAALEESGLSLDTSLSKLTSQQEQIIKDNKASIEEKRDSLDSLVRTARASGHSSDALDDIKDVLDGGYNDTADQNMKVLKALVEFRKMSEAQGEKVSGTYDDLSRVMEDQLLSSRQIEKVGKQQLKSGEGFFEKFADKGLGAIEGTGQKGLMSVAGSFMGLGGLGNVVEELWDLTDLVKEGSVLRKGISGTGNVLKKAGGALGRKMAPKVRAGMLAANLNFGGMNREGGAGGMQPAYMAGGGFVKGAASLLGKAATSAADHFGNLPTVSPRGSDTAPIMGTPGEFMVSKKGVQSAGADELHSINQGQSGTLKKILEQQTQTNLLLGNFSRAQSGIGNQMLSGQGKLLRFAKITADETEDVAEKIGKIKGGGGSGSSTGLLSGLAEMVPLGGMLKKVGPFLRTALNVAKTAAGGPMGVASKAGATYLASMAVGGAYNLYKKNTDRKAYDENMEEFSQRSTLGKAMHPGDLMSAISDGLSGYVDDFRGATGRHEEAEDKIRGQKMTDALVNRLIKQGKLDEAAKVLDKANKDASQKKTLNKFQEAMHGLLGDHSVLADFSDTLTDLGEGLMGWLSDAGKSAKDMLGKVSDSIGLTGAVDAVKGVGAKARDAVKGFFGMEGEEQTAKFIEREEGSSDKVYKDIAGLPTVGKGHLLTDSPRDQAIKARGFATPEESQDIYKEDLAKHTEPWMKKLKPGTNLTPEMKTAITSLAFNAGPNSKGVNDIVADINQGKIAEAANVFDKYNKTTINGKKVVVKALADRRAREKALFLAHPMEAAPAKAEGMTTQPMVMDASADRMSRTQAGTQREAVVAQAKSTPVPMPVPAPGSSGGSNPQRGPVRTTQVDDVYLSAIAINLMDG